VLDEMCNVGAERVELREDRGGGCHGGGRGAVAVLWR
jgi:hypothetical protein